MAKFAVILPAAGRSSRFHDKNYKKPFAPLANKAVWLHSAERFLNRNDVKQMILVISPEDREDFQLQVRAPTSRSWASRWSTAARSGPIRSPRPWPGSSRRPISSASTTPPGPAWPTRGSTTIFEAAEKTGAAIFAIPVAGTLKRVGADHKIEETVSRDGLWEAQTPQVFRRAAAAGGLRQARRLPGHRRRPTGRADRPPGDRRARLADQPEDHHQRGSAPGRAGAEGPAQAQARRPGPSVCRRRHVAVATCDVATATAAKDTP